MTVVRDQRLSQKVEHVSESDLRMALRVTTVFALLLCAIHEAASQSIYRTYWFSDAQKAQIIQIHNRLRATEPAANMQELVWDERLAAIAHGHTLTCNAWHRNAYERRGYGYVYIGENIWWSNEPYLRSDLRSAMLEFYDEKPYYNYYTGACSTATCGHYTQFVWAETCAVGCAAVYCDGIRNGRGITRGHIIVCNYGEGGNTMGQHPFVMGPRCSRCPRGGGCTSEGLCAPTCSGQRFPQGVSVPVAPPAVKSWYYKPGVAQKQPKDYYKKTMMAVNRVLKCADYYDSCGKWAARGECRGRHAPFMARFCARSCNFCVRHRRQRQRQRNN